jgi:H/ACA ribonucleoprotein complex non-core subunit NAF1
MYCLCLVIIQSDTPCAINETSVLFTDKRQSLGTVFEIFGPVARPLYSVRFNTTEEITAAELHVGDVVYFAPKEDAYTKHIFTQKLKECVY